MIWIGGEGEMNERREMERETDGLIGKGEIV